MIYSLFHKAIHGGSGHEFDDDKISMKKKKSETSYQTPGRSQDSIGGSGDRRSEDLTTNKSSTQCTVTCVYLTKIAGMCRNVTVTWCKNLINQSLNISVDEPGERETNYTCKIDLKPWHFWSKKGLKSFNVSGKRVDVFWDLRSAKFSGSPEPSGDYYVALVSDEEVGLLLGECKKEAYKRTKSRPSLMDAELICKKDNVFGKKCFTTRAKFDERKKEHDIVVENSIAGPRDPEMWISIDGIVLIHIRNLQWKFRGNETVIVNKTPVQVLWDVHDWLFSSSGLGHGVFIFKPGAPEYRLDDFKDGSSSVSGDSTSSYFSTQSVPTSPDFCLFLYAWKVE